MTKEEEEEKMPEKKVRKAPAEEEKRTEEKKHEEEVVEVAAEPEKEEPTPAAAPSHPNNPQPTDQEIRDAIVSMIKGADLEEISIKKIRIELEEKFGCPMKEKKEMIKQIVTESIDM